MTNCMDIFLYNTPSYMSYTKHLVLGLEIGIHWNKRKKAKDHKEGKRGKLNGGQAHWREGGGGSKEIISRERCVGPYQG